MTIKDSKFTDFENNFPGWIIVEVAYPHHRSNENAEGWFVTATNSSAKASIMEWGDTFQNAINNCSRSILDFTTHRIPILLGQTEEAQQLLIRHNVTCCPRPQEFNKTRP